MRLVARTDLAERVSGLPLRWRIGALVLLGLVGIFTLFGLLGSALAQDGRERTIRQWSSLTESTARFIDSEVEAQFATLTAVSVRVRDAGPDPSRRSQLLGDVFVQPGSFVAGAFLLDPSGAVVWSQADSPAALASFIQADPHVRDPLAGAQRYASGVESFDGRAAVLLAVPVPGADGRPAGVLGMAIRPDKWVVDDLVAGAHGIANTGHAELIDQMGMVIVSSETGHMLGPGEHPDFYDPLLAHHSSAIGLTAPVGPVDPADQGQRHEMAFVSLVSAPWGLALGGSEAELTADANRWQQQLALFGGLTLALALLLVWLTTRSVSRPIRALTAASRSIAAGDLSTPIPHDGEGEVRELAQAFDQMRGALQTALSSLAVEESRYEGIVTSMADAVVTTDTDLRITAFNPSAARLTGSRLEDVLGRRSCDVICSTGGTPQTCGSSCPVLAPGFDVGVTKDVIRTADGREITMAITRSGIRDESGQLAGIVHVLRDVSAEEEVARLKDEFLSTVSHELRTPLGFIMGYGTTLLLPDAPEDKAETRRCIQVIVDASKELQELVDNLLDMTKIGARSLSVTPEAVPLEGLVRSAVERIRIRGSAHRLSVSMPRSLPAVRADARRVEQVLYNLLDNAIKYSPDGGRVEVRAAASDGEVTVSVIDEGLGIPANELSSLFERFYRGTRARARAIGGTGLGLAICRGIVLAHGGRIWAESPADHRSGAPRGTVIRFTLPVARARTSPRGRSEPSAVVGA
jgi:two-component system phosphate regulon sensor histidine kinase PhoR